MSEEQFNHYLVVRSDEIKQDARKKMNPMRAGDDEMKTFRVNSRLACDFAIPPDLQTKEETEAPSEDDPPLKEGILAKIRASPDRYLTKEALSRFSPKMLQIFTNIMETGSDTNQLLYSQYKSLEGI